MPNYETMYYALFNSLTDAIEILQKAQQEGEQLFIEEKKTSEIEPSATCENKSE